MTEKKRSVCDDARMYETVVRRGAIGRLSASMAAVSVVAGIAVILALNGPFSILIGLLLFVVAASLILYPLTTRYTFDHEKLSILDLSLQEPPAYYGNIISVTDSDKMMAGSHCTAAECIVIEYTVPDTERRHKVAISPTDKAGAIGLLKERCPQASFSVSRRSL